MLNDLAERPLGDSYATPGPPAAHLDTAACFQRNAGAILRRFLTLPQNCGR